MSWLERYIWLQMVGADAIEHGLLRRSAFASDEGFCRFAGDVWEGMLCVRGLRV